MQRGSFSLQPQRELWRYSLFDRQGLKENIMILACKYQRPFMVPFLYLS